MANKYVQLRVMSSPKELADMCLNYLVSRGNQCPAGAFECPLPPDRLCSDTTPEEWESVVQKREE